MINYSEINAVKLSPTKKDFYQIWNELLETAGKISERWDPSSTNESDPGVVLLKVLTAVADKLNYQIDENILEAFMPSAAQQESMRKLTEMLGYNMKYYQSATTDVTITYNKSLTTPIDGTIFIDKFTNVKDIDNTINYVTLEKVYFNKDSTTRIIPCMEGELVACETDNDNIISVMQLDDNNRYYLPETQIAENGIFVTNIDNGVEAEAWEKVDNLNTQPAGKHCFKFGFDSKENLPYIQFPADIETIIEDGLRINYLRTNGINGNISPKILCKFEKPLSWTALENNNEGISNIDYLNPDNYIVSNAGASKNGRNPESLTDAYNNYKKTIGTFDTLITCRDYMNKIYQMTTSETENTNLVSNVIVSDIRDDINKAFTLCTFGKNGTEYKTLARPLDFTHVDETLDKAGWNAKVAAGADPDGLDFNKLYKVTETSAPDSKVIAYYRGIFDGNAYGFAEVSQHELNHFDLVLYPFKNIYGLNSKAEFVKSFKYDDSNNQDILEGIKENKTISHNIVSPDGTDLACIKNYFNLSAKVTTIRKVNAIEQADILGNIYTKLYENFNMRKVDFGEEIPYDAILKVMEEADTRIKSISLEDPILETKFCTVAGGEYGFSNKNVVGDLTGQEQAGNAYYNKLVLNNVLAGRVPLFNYDGNFKPDYAESAYPAWYDGSTQHSYNLLYPSAINEDKTNGISKITTELRVDSGASDFKLNPNEVIQFRLQNLRTIKTYPAYVNYYVKLNVTGTTPAICATMLSLKEFLNKPTNVVAPDYEAAVYQNMWEAAANYIHLFNKKQSLEITSATDFNSQLTAHNALFKLVEESGLEYLSYCSAFDNTVHTYYYIDLNDGTFGSWNAWVETLIGLHGGALNGLYYGKPIDLSNNFGYLVDKYHRQYLQASVFKSDTKPFERYYVQETHTTTTADYTANGLGQDAVLRGIAKDEEYRLKQGEYLLINYTSSTSTEGDKKTVINEIYSWDRQDDKGNVIGTIIKPNFELIDSDTYRSTHAWNKTSGFDFTGAAITQPQGMFTMGTDQQIEIREVVNVTLDNEQTNIYWERNDEVVGANDRIIFNFDEDPVTYNGGTVYTAYTLKDGEYFYYTNRDKTDIAYYGSGTRIKCTPNTPLIFKSSKDAMISAEEIATNGLSSAIPWRAYNFSNTGDTNKSLVLTEYQYKNLLPGNTLSGVSTATLDPATIEINIGNNWQKIKGAKFIIDGATSSLPAVSLNASEEDDAISWEIRSRLEINVGPTKIQQLYKEDGKYSDHITLQYKEDGITKTVELTPQTAAATLAIKANKVLQSSRTELDTTTVEYNETGGITEKLYDCQVKVFNLQNITDAENTSISFGNYDNGNFTKLSFNKMDSSHQGLPFATVNILVPEDHEGIIMIEDVKISTTSNNAAIRLIKSSGSETNEPLPPQIYNNNGSWWEGRTSTRALWATEGKVYVAGEIGSNTKFDELKAHLYRRTEESRATAPDISARHRYDYLNAKYYTYESATAEAYDNTKVYCELLDIGGTDLTVFELKDGINIIRLIGSSKLQIIPDAQYADNVILGNLDIIYSGENAINPKLKYKLVDEASIDAQILADINKVDVDHQFYYNAVMSNDTMIDLNLADPDDTLENPFNWFDYNNINNKFVISEINAEYLPIGVTIARGSKLN